MLFRAIRAFLSDASGPERWMGAEKEREREREREKASSYSQNGITNDTLLARSVARLIRFRALFSIRFAVSENKRKKRREKKLISRYTKRRAS